VAARLFTLCPCEARVVIAPCLSRRQQREHEPVFLAEVGPRHALHVGDGHVLENVELAVRGSDVVVDDDRMRELPRLLLRSTGGSDVVARELILRALQSWSVIGSVLSDRARR